MWSTGFQPLLPLRHVEMGKRHFHSFIGGISLPEQCITKRFQNPNFVNKHNPFVHGKHLSSSQAIVNTNQPTDIVNTTVKVQEINQTKVITKQDAMGSSRRNRRNRKRNRRRNKNNKAVRTETAAEQAVLVPSSPLNIVRMYKTSVAFTISPPKSCYLHVRQPSVCESEDSLVIVFESDDDDDDDDYQATSVSDDNQTVFTSDDESSSNLDETNQTGCNKNTVNTKKVRFASDDSLCEVHPMVQWSFAYQAARRGPWEEYARDRERFKLRISNVESVLNPILLQNHRTSVYEERFNS